MNTRQTRPFLNLTVLATVALLLCAVALTHAQTTVITSLPYVITTGGNYVLNNNLLATQPNTDLITINASNVTLDLQGHYVSGPTTDNTPGGTGIAARLHSNLTIKNGTVSHCQYGVYIAGDYSNTSANANEVIDNMRVTSISRVGIYIECAPSSRITNCQLSVIGNSNGGGTGIFASLGITVQGNQISNLIGGSNLTTGISMEPGCFARTNQISNAGTAIGCNGSIYQDNLAVNCPHGFNGGTDGGGNVHN